MKICDVMTDGIISIGLKEPVSAAARLLKSKNIGALPVCDENGKLRGILTDRDIVTRCVASGFDPIETKVEDIMSRGVVFASPFDELEHAVRVMSRDQIRRLPIMDRGRLVGMVSLCDMARNCNCDMEAAEALAEISSNLKRK
ncbi:MAG: CBS domain-containing protein [Oscillospiraceae bacterium]|nr:CBS domain-containing protein [Oscillospiraceae bacterium]